MGGPPMMGAPPMRRPIRRGTSKAVPLVVSAGLAVGVFCGLLFGVGAKPASGPSKGNNVKKVSSDEEGDPGSAPKGLGATTVVSPKAPPPTPPPQPTVAPPPAPKVAKVIVEIKPEAAAKVAKISVDGQEITGNSTDVPAEKKSVKVEVKASGYRSTEQKVEIVEGEEMTLKIDMVKRPSGGGSNIRPPKRIDKPPGSKSNDSGGLIDI